MWSTTFQSFLEAVYLKAYIYCVDGVPYLETRVYLHLRFNHSTSVVTGPKYENAIISLNITPILKLPKEQLKIHREAPTHSLSRML